MLYEVITYLFDLDDEMYAGLQMFAKKVAVGLKKAIPCLKVGVMVLGLEVPHAHVITSYSIHYTKLYEQKFLYLPESKNDFVFAIVCEELGFIGALVVIILFLLFTFRGFYIASNRITSYNVCYTKLLRMSAQIAFLNECEHFLSARLPFLKEQRFLLKKE